MEEILGEAWARLAEPGFGHPDALGVTWEDVLGEW